MEKLEALYSLVIITLHLQIKKYV